MKTSNSRPRRTCSLSHLWRHQFNITRYSWSANSRVRIDLSAQQSVSDIDGIPTNKIEKRYHCWWKNGGKMAHHTHNWHPTFCDSQEEYETQKEARVKGPRKGKGQEKVRNGQSQKIKSKFWFMRSPRLKDCSFLYLILGKSMGNKIAFSEKNNRVTR